MAKNLTYSAADDFIIGTLDDKRWIAATTCSPYLCFEAESRDAVRAKLRAAVKFCRKISAALEQQIANLEASHIRRLDVKEAGSVKELELA
jgi:hypothetical protein